MHLDNSRKKNARGLCGMLVFCLLTSSLTASAERSEPYKSGTLLADGQIKVAWNITVPMLTIEKVKYIELLDENLYVTTNRGQVNAIRAHDGRFRWMRKLADLNEPLWQPSLYYDHKNDRRLAAFALNTEVVFIDPDEGNIRFRREISDVNVAPATTGPNALFTSEIHNRVHKYNVEDNYTDWEIRRRGKLRLSPVYRYDEDLLIFADDSGHVAGCGADEKVEQFSTDLRGIPAGMTADDGAVYVATLDRLLYKVSHKTGNILWKEYLSSRPIAPPIVSDGYVYQATDAGLLRLEKDRQEPPHRFERSAALLADWPERLVLLGKEGDIRLIDKKSLKPLSEIRLPDAVLSFTNLTGNAAFIATPQGVVYCLTPADVSLTVEDFHVPTPERILHMKKTKDEKAIEEIGDVDEAEEQGEQ